MIKIDLESRIKNLGYKGLKSGLIAMMKKYPKGEVADMLGISTSFLNRQLRALKITENINRKKLFEAKLDKWNKEHGTSYSCTKEWLACLYREHGSAKTAEMTGAYQNYVCQCLREWENIEAKREVQEQIPKPEGYDLPYVGGSCPCLECEIHLQKIEKSNCHCRKCEKRVAYAARYDDERLRANGEIAPANSRSTFREYNLSW